MRIISQAIGIGIFAGFFAACSMTPDLDFPSLDLMEAPPYDPVAEDPAIDPAHPPGILELSFESEGQQLNGHIYLANGAGPHPTVIMLHGYPGNEKSLDLAHAMRRAGYNVLFFHYRGSWGSEGDFGVENAVEDVAAGVAHLRENVEAYRVDPAKITLIGHSLGGFTALQSAARDPSIACVAGLAAADFGIIGSGMIEDEQAGAEFAGYTDALVKGPLDGTSGQIIVSEIKNGRDRFRLKGLSRPLSGKSVLIVSARNDEVLPPDVFHGPLVAAFEAEAGIDLSHDLLDGDHSFSWTRIELARTVISWLDASCR